MKQLLTLTILMTLTLFTGQAQNPEMKSDTNITVMAQNQSNQLTCKLTTPELQQRKKTVLASLKKQLIEKKELPNGYAFKFKGSDVILDELTTFIKTERQCCGFFIFNLSISGDQSEAWLQLTGPKGVKGMITGEMGF